MLLQTRVQFISSTVGVGVVAEQPLPAGTIVWVADPLDRLLSSDEVASLPALARDSAMRFMYRDNQGRYMLLWDHAKYVNHSFTPNCMPTPYGCDMVIRDIAVGEELTGDYGMLNIIENFSPEPEASPYARSVVRGDDLLRCAQDWDARLKPALLACTQIDQPLWDLLELGDAKALQRLSRGEEEPRSLSSMYCPHPPGLGIF